MRIPGSFTILGNHDTDPMPGTTIENVIFTVTDRDAHGVYAGYCQFL